MKGKFVNYSWTDVKDFETLKNLEHKPQGPRHIPVPHFYAIEFFKEKLKEHNIEVTAERAALSPDTYKMIYLADVKPLDGKVSNDFSFSVGFLNNNDRTRAFTGIAGTHVYLNNSQMYVSEGAFKTRHTTNVHEYLNDRIGNVITWFKNYYAEQSGRVDKMKNTPCDDKILGSVLLHYIRKPYSLSSTNIKNIVKEYDTPKYEAFKERNLWSLQNTTMEVFKRVKSPLYRLEAMEVFTDAIDQFLK